MLAMNGDLIENKSVYARSLGWHEYTEEGDRIPAGIVVLNATIGYNIIRIGEEIEMIEWYNGREDAIDCAVDHCRSEIAAHELRQAERG